MVDFANHHNLGIDKDRRRGVELGENSHAREHEYLRVGICANIAEIFFTNNRNRENVARLEHLIDNFIYSRATHCYERWVSLKFMTRRRLLTHLKQIKRIRQYSKIYDQTKIIKLEITYFRSSWKNDTHKLKRILSIWLFKN